MQKPKTFEHIEALTEEFGNGGFNLQCPKCGYGEFPPQEMDWWQARILLAIAQQLSVIAAELRKKGGGQ